MTANECLLEIEVFILINLKEVAKGERTEVFCQEWISCPAMPDSSKWRSKDDGRR